MTPAGNLPELGPPPAVPRPRLMGPALRGPRGCSPTDERCSEVSRQPRAAQLCPRPGAEAHVARQRGAERSRPVAGGQRWAAGVSPRRGHWGPTSGTWEAAFVGVSGPFIPFGLREPSSSADGTPPCPSLQGAPGQWGARGFQRAPQDVLTPSPQSLANCRPVSYSAPGVAEPDAGRLQSQALNTEFYAGGIRPFIFRAPSEENRKLALKTRTLDGFWSRAFKGEDRGPGVGGRGRSRLVGSCASPVALLG